MKITNLAYKLYLVCIVGLLAVMAYVVYTGIQIYLWSAKGENLIDSTVPYTRQVADGQDILVLGDSLAYGVGASAPENSFAGQLGALFPDHSIINKAEVGDATQQLADSIQGKMDKRYDITFVFIGGNDIIRSGIDLEVSKANLAAIAEVAAARSNQVYLLTSSDFANVSMIPWFLADFYSGRSAEVREAAQDLAGRYGNVDYIDVFEQEPGLYATFEAADRFHLNDQGIKQLMTVIASYRAAGD